MNFTPEKRKHLTKWFIGVAAACILIYLGVQNIGMVAGALSWVVGLFAPLLVGCAFALILNVPMRFWESHLFQKAKRPFWQKLRRPLAFLLSLLFILGVLAGVVLLIIPELSEALRVIVHSAAAYVTQLSSMDQQQIAELPFGEWLLNTDWDSLLKKLQTWLTQKGGNLVNVAFGTIGSVVGGVFDAFIAFVFSIYILFSKEKLAEQFSALIRVWLPKRAGEWLVHAASVASVNFRNFVSGQSIEAVILGLLCMLGMWILRIPYAPMVGALVGVTALVPVVGSLIGAGVGAFVIVTVSPIKALIFIVFLIILQQLEGNLIYPKVMGSRVNLPGMWILAAVTVGGGVAGPLGMLLSVPIASTAYVLLKEATLRREEAKKAEITPEEN